MPAPMLFQSLTLKSVTFVNRIMVSPMGQCSAVDGCATDWHLMHLGNMAISGAGALCIEATAISPTGRNTPVDLGIWGDKQAESMKPAIAFCRANSDVKLGIQLWHVGRKGSVRPAWERHKPIPKEEGGWTVYGPSDVPYPKRWTPVAMNDEQIGGVVKDFRDAARRADALGLDFLEVHGAHGYLLHNFLSPLTNKRTDKYGGDLQGRMRFVLEVAKAVREVWPQNKPLGIRLSCTDWVEGGWNIKDSVALAKELKAVGYDYITASSGGSVPEQDIKIGPSYQVPFAEAIKKQAGITTVAVGLITETKQAEGILAEGKADMIALARGMIYNPRWPWHAAIELGVEPSFPAQYERAHPAMRRTDFLKAKRD
jgi:2,4-dienoyl-CoA reductase-like NADH-dependent reductase (Old Yellow Enzyme family)